MLMSLKGVLDAPNIITITEDALMQPLRDILLHRPHPSCVMPSLERGYPMQEPRHGTQGMFILWEGLPLATHSSPPSDKSNVRTLWRVTKLACLEK